MANKVNKPFRDKFTKIEYVEGDPYTHEDEKRIAFLVEKGYLEKSKAKPKKVEK